MKSFSLLQVLRVAVLLYEWLDIPILKRYYDFGFDHYNLQWHKAGITGLVDTLLNKSGPFVHGNWVLPDLSIHSAVQLNKNLRTFDKTFYFRCVNESIRLIFDSCWLCYILEWVQLVKFNLVTCFSEYLLSKAEICSLGARSYATKGTKKWFSLWTLPGSILGTHPLLFIRSLQICLWRHPRELPVPYEGYRWDATFVWHTNLWWMHISYWSGTLQDAWVFMVLYQDKIIMWLRFYLP